MLLVTLDIIRSLANECRRDIGLFSPFLITSVEVTLTALITDLEVVARAATVVRVELILFEIMSQRAS